MKSESGFSLAIASQPFTNICLGGASTGAHQFPWRLLVQTENHGEHNQLTHHFSKLLLTI